jgi:ectoine hydroxylase-related dioxygenase (phytanoyl-CoA dioxygenase family)
MATSSTASLEAPYDVHSDDIALFEEKGFIKLPDVLSPETISAFEPEITGKVLELNTMHLPLEERSTYHRAFLQVTNLWQHSEPVRELVFSRRLAAIAAALLGVDGVRLYHDQALYKEPGGGLTPLHADQYYWPMASDRCCTIWIPLQDTPLEMGPLMFASGSHRFEFGRDMEISDESERAIQAALAKQELPIVQQPYQLGEASFHLGWTFHRAGPNTTDTPRRVLTIIYMDADMVVGEPVNDQQRADLDAWFPGTQPGEPADTPLNPVLYRRS